MTTTGSTHTIAVGERISVQITRSIAPFSIEVSDLTGGTWSPQPVDNGTLTTQGGFNAPPPAGATISFSILFNFIPAPVPSDATKDFYTVTVSGSGGGSFHEKVFGPGFTTRTYEFSVVLV